MPALYFRRLPGANPFSLESNHVFPLGHFMYFKLMPGFYFWWLPDPSLNISSIKSCIFSISGGMYFRVPCMPGLDMGLAKPSWILVSLAWLGFLSGPG